jgi:hypothetical protein
MESAPVAMCRRKPELGQVSTRFVLCLSGVQNAADRGSKDISFVQRCYPPIANYFDGPAGGDWIVAEKENMVPGGRCMSPIHQITLSLPAASAFVSKQPSIATRSPLQHRLCPTSITLILPPCPPIARPFLASATLTGIAYHHEAARTLLDQ